MTEIQQSTQAEMLSLAINTLAAMRNAQELWRDIFHEGDIEVWYMRPEWFPRGIYGYKPDPNHLEESHILLGKVADYDDVAALDRLFAKLQAEFWSPNGEARNLIQVKGLRHTSMSVGDCVKLTNGEVWVCAMVGWELVK